MRGTWPPILEDDHAADEIAALDVGYVVAFHSQGQGRQAQFFLELRHGLQDYVGVIQPFDTVLGQPLNGVLCNNVHQFLVLPPLWADQTHRSFAPGTKPVPDEVLVLGGVLDVNHGRDYQGVLVELPDELADYQLGRLVLGSFHEKVVPANELAPPNEENLHPGLVAALGQGYEVHIPARVGLDLNLLLLGDLVYAPDLVPEHRRAFKLQLSSSGFHFLP